MTVEFRANPCGVAPLVGLCARRPHRRAPAAVQQFELNARRVDGEAHQAPERVNLTDEMPFCGAANRGIAGHLRDGVLRERANADAAAHLRRGPRRFHPGMAGADYKDIEIAQGRSLSEARIQNPEARSKKKGLFR
jgi:hypothetical protein